LKSSRLIFFLEEQPATTSFYPQKE